MQSKLKSDYTQHLITLMTQLYLRSKSFTFKMLLEYVIYFYGHRTETTPPKIQQIFQASI